MATTTLYPKESAIREGIKAVGIGKKGSRALSRELAETIWEELNASRVPPLERGAFFAALFLKGITPEEKLLAGCFPSGVFDDAAALASDLAADAPAEIRNICTLLLQGKELDKIHAYRLGQFLLSQLPGDGARGLAASVLRVRYETADEYAGLLQAMQETIQPAFRQAVPPGDPIVQLAEPFDGVDQSMLITPLIASHLIKRGYRLVHLIGRSSGPKRVLNLLDLARGLQCRPVQSALEITDAQPRFGHFANQEDLSKPIDRWVDLRRRIVKRPFMATLERFLDPFGADILIASAFHPPYTEKMITIAERLAVKAAMIVRNGIEGTLAFPLLRSAKIMCSARQADGSYLRQEFDFDPQAALSHGLTIEEKIEHPDVRENTRLVEQFSRNGTTDNEHFNVRIQATRRGFDLAFDWIESHAVFFNKRSKQ